MITERPAKNGEVQENRLLALARAQPGLTALLLMSLVGIGISIYLTIVHYDKNTKLVCTTGGVVNCQQVTSSAYSVIPFTNVPITIPGMLWFIALGVAAFLGLRAVWREERELQWLRGGTLLWTIGGMLFVIYLLYAEIVKVQRLCEWCTVIHLLTFASLLIALTRWQRRFDLPAQFAPRASVKAGPPQQSLRANAVARSSSPAMTHRARRGMNQRGGRGR